MFQLLNANVALNALDNVFTIQAAAGEGGAWAGGVDASKCEALLGRKLRGVEETVVAAVEALVAEVGGVGRGAGERKRG